MMPGSFDPAKDAVNRRKHRLSLAFGDRIFEDDDHLILPSIREIDGEGAVQGDRDRRKEAVHRVFVWRGDLPRFISVRRSNKGEEKAYRAAC